MVNIGQINVYTRQNERVRPSESSRNNGLHFFVGPYMSLAGLRLSREELLAGLLIV